MKIWRRLAFKAMAAAVALLACAPAGSAETTALKIVTEHPDFAELVMKGDFNQIETIAADYRATKARSAGAFWALETLYGQLSDFSEKTCDCDTAGGAGAYTFDQKRQAFESWLKAKPGSLTATIGFADLWQRYAWHGRGVNWAAKTTADQWGDFEDRMNRAVDLLAPLDPKTDPQIYLIEMEGVSAGDNPRARLDEIYARAIQTFPDFPDYAAERFRFLREFWYGKPGEAAAFTQSLLTAPGGDDGLIAYFSAARGLLTTTRDSTAMGISGATYPNLIKAFALRRRTFGPSWADMNVLMYYAMASGDKKSVAMLAKTIGDHWVTSVWNTKGDFDNVVAWATAWP